MDAVKRSFAPVVDPGVRVMVLGSLPGVQSLALARYYGNPRNQFWALMSGVIDRDLVPMDYDERLRTLLGARVGLWDTVGSARRSGSLDGAIKDHVANDLLTLIDTLPQLRAVAFNGGKSASIGLRQLAARTDLSLVPLPSSSPAFTLPFEAKREQWMKLRDYLE
jgi:hypoxanthine-DNA glycosylase